MKIFVNFELLMSALLILISSTKLLVSQQKIKYKTFHYQSKTFDYGFSVKALNTKNFECKFHIKFLTVTFFCI